MTKVEKVNVLKNIIIDGMIAFEHGFNAPYIRGKRVWGIDTERIYFGGKLKLSNLTNIELDILIDAVTKYISYVKTC